MLTALAVKALISKFGLPVTCDQPPTNVYPLGVDILWGIVTDDKASTLPDSAALVFNVNIYFMLLYC